MTDTSQTKLIAIGDDLAKGVEIAQGTRSWMGTIERAEVEAALEGIAPEHAESAQRAVLRIALSRGWSPASIAGFDTLRKHALPKSAPRESEDTNGASNDEPLPDGIADAAVPNDEVVTAYVVRGALARYVEGAAARNRDFAEELAQCIDALEQAGEKVGETARAWRKLARREAEATSQAAPANVVALVIPAKKADAAKPSGISMYIAPIALAASVVLVATGAFVFHQRAQQAEAERAEAVRRAQEEQKTNELNKLIKELDEHNKAIQIAENEAAQAKSEAERQMAIAKLQSAQEQQRRTQAGISAVRAAGGGTGAGNAASPVRAKPACTCQAGDPLCSCL